MSQFTVLEINMIALTLGLMEVISHLAKSIKHHISSNCGHIKKALTEFLHVSALKLGGPTWNRTKHLLIMSQLL